MDFWSCFWEIREKDFYELVGSIVSNMVRINTKKELNQHAKRHWSIDNSVDFYLFILSRKFKTLSWIMNHNLLSRTLSDKFDFKFSKFFNFSALFSATVQIVHSKENGIFRLQWFGWLDVKGRDIFGCLWVYGKDPSKYRFGFSLLNI